MTINRAGFLGSHYRRNTSASSVIWRQVMIVSSITMVVLETSDDSKQYNNGGLGDK